jgi:hypothetical protein
MDQFKFDQLVRRFAKSHSRRGLLAAAGAFLALRPRLAGANQLLPAACAQTGQVCTLHYGCCSGLTCATSAINPSYGVCIPGAGGMITTGTSLVVPFDGSDPAQAQAVADSLTTTTTSTTTTTVDDREAEREALEAQRDARKAQVDARRDTKKSTLETRRDTQQQRREDAREAADLADGPNLRLKIEFRGTQDEYLQVRNVDDVSSVLLGIGATTTPIEGSGLGENQSGVTLQPGETFRFVLSTPGEAVGKLTEASYAWTSQPVCTTLDQAYFVLTAFSATGATTEVEISCSQPEIDTSTVFSPGTRKRSRRNRQVSRGRQQSRGRRKNRGKRN